MKTETTSGNRGLLQAEPLIFETGHATGTGVDLATPKGGADRAGGSCSALARWATMPVPERCAVGSAGPAARAPSVARAWAWQTPAPAFRAPLLPDSELAPVTLACEVTDRPHPFVYRVRALYEQRRHQRDR